MPSSTMWSSTWRSALTALWAVAALGYAGASSALGVGDITVKSALNQPLEAEIELLSVSARERDQINVVVAPRDVFDRMGIERSPIVDQLQFKVVEKPDGRIVVSVNTPSELQEPFLNFLIEVNWPTGRMLREFTVLLDPPKLTEDHQAQTPQAPETQTPKEIAAALPPPIPMPKAEPAIPPPPPVVEETKPEEAPVAAAPVSPPPRPTVATSEELEYGPVKAGQYLWSVADQMRPKNIHVSQMMVALLRDNPQAFIGNNINRLKAGQVLRIKDTAQLESVGVDEAIAEVEKQYQEWLTFRKGRLARHQATQLADNKSAATDDADAPKKTTSEGKRKAAKGTRLELVTPKAKPSAEQAESERAAAREAAKSLDKMRADLNQAASNLDRMRNDNQNKKTQVSALEKQISDMQLLIALKDQELHLLQQRMREKGIDPEEGAFKGREESPLGKIDMSVSADKRVPSIDKSQEKKDAKSDQAKVAAAKGSRWWANPWIWLGLGASLVVLAVGLWWRGRRDQMQQFEVDDDAPAEQTNLAATLPKGRTTPIIVDESSVVVDTATNPASGVVTKHESDPLSEAEVYLTYGRYQKAKEVLKSAIQADPDRHELKLKLLETYYFAEDHVGFEKQAEELYAALGGQPGPLWDKATELGQDLVPNHPLFRPIGGTDLAETMISPPDRSEPKSADLAGTLALDTAKNGADKVKRISAVEAARPPAWAMERSEVAASRRQQASLDETIVQSSGLQRPVESYDAPQEDSSILYPSSRSTMPAMEAGRSEFGGVQSTHEVQAPITEEELLREEAEVRAMLEEAVSSYITAMEQGQTAPEGEELFSGSSGMAATELRTSEPSGQRSHTHDEVESSSSALRAAVDHIDQEANEEHQALLHEEGLHESQLLHAVDPEPEAATESPISQFSHSRFAALQEATGEPSRQTAAIERSTAYSLALFQEQNALPETAETRTIAQDAAPAAPREDTVSGSGNRRLETATSSPRLETGMEDDLDEDTFFLFNDEVGTKLDLARAYIEMGDTDGAREILDEVMGEGSDKHKAEAQDLIRLVDKAATGQIS